MVKVVITGGLGFLGRQVCRRLLERGRIFSPVAGAEAPVSSVTLFDVADPLSAAARAQADTGASHARGEDLGMLLDPRVSIALGDLKADASSTARALVDTDDVAVFHLASMMSGDSEGAFDDAWATNVEGQRALLEAMRARGGAGRPRFVFTSSVALLGGDAARTRAHDGCKLLPENTYGYTKAVCELMLNEYARRGFVDGRGVRLPSIVVRPGAPNAATTSCFSGVVREPLDGAESVLPVPLDLPHPAASVGVAVGGILDLMRADAANLDADRVYNLPSIGVTLGALKGATEKLAATCPAAAPSGLGSWVERPDARLTAIVAGMPQHTDGGRAVQLGLRQDASVDELVAEYARDILQVALP